MQCTASEGGGAGVRTEWAGVVIAAEALVGVPGGIHTKPFGLTQVVCRISIRHPVVQDCSSAVCSALWGPCGLTRAGPTVAPVLRWWPRFAFLQRTSTVFVLCLHATLHKSLRALLYYRPVQSGAVAVRVPRPCVPCSQTGCCQLACLFRIAQGRKLGYQPLRPRLYLREFATAHCSHHRRHLRVQVTAAMHAAQCAVAQCCFSECVCEPLTWAFPWLTPAGFRLSKLAAARGDEMMMMLMCSL